MLEDQDDIRTRDSAISSRTEIPENVMRVCFFTPESTGGSIVVMSDVVEELSQLPGFSCTAIFRKHGHENVLSKIRSSLTDHTILDVNPRQEESEGGEWRRPNRQFNVTQFLERHFPSSVANLYSSVRAFLINLRNDRRIIGPVRQFIIRSRPDVIYLNGLGGSELVLLIAKRVGIPCILHCHMFLPDNWYVRWLLRRVDQAICISRAIQENLTDLGCRQADLVPNGVDLSRYDSPRDMHIARRILGVPAQGHVVGVVGRIVEWKGQSCFIEAISILLERGLDVRGVIVGEADNTPLDQLYLNSLHKLCHQLYVAEKISWLGFQDDIQLVMNALDILVLCSSEPEPFGMVIIEAMAAGTPVVATAAGGPLEIIENGRNGLLVEPMQPLVMANAIREILESGQKAKELSKHGRNTVREKYGTKNQISIICRLLTQLTGKRQISS